MVFPPVALWVTVGLAVCLLGLLIALAAVCRRKIKESCEEDRAAKELEEAKELQEEEQSKTGAVLARRRKTSKILHLNPLFSPDSSTTPPPFSFPQKPHLCGQWCTCVRWWA
ncbi:uncharacterized protein ACWYII_020789 isoform 1-T1 [Salvelinus alpinus]